MLILYIQYIEKQKYGILLLFLVNKEDDRLLGPCSIPPSYCKYIWFASRVYVYCTVCRACACWSRLNPRLTGWQQCVNGYQSPFEWVGREVQPVSTLLE